MASKAPLQAYLTNHSVIWYSVVYSVFLQERKADFIFSLPQIGSLDNGRQIPTKPQIDVI